MKNKKGFTLIEILAVIIILGLLASVAMVSVSRYRIKSLEKEKGTIFSSIKSSFYNYRIKESINNEEEIALSNLSFDKPVVYNGKRCEGTVWYVFEDNTYQDIDISGNKTNVTGTLEKTCIFLKCGDEIVFDKECR